MSGIEVQKIGKYRIESEIGRGAMGTVYKGIDPVIERLVAIKTIHLPEDADADIADQIARFKREAQAAGRLLHPNIVAVYEYGEEGDMSYIAMEFVKGRSLKDLFDAKERLGLEEIARIMIEILVGLGYSHKKGVIHRDIKPANIMLDEGGAVKITDFGIARIESSTMTQLGTVLGTPSYMSPEQVMGQPVDNRTDLYSAGMVLYEMLTGDKAFSGSINSILYRVLNTEPLPPSALNVTLPAAFDAVVMKACAKRPDDRYANAEAFAEDLRLALRSARMAGPSASADDRDYEATMVVPRSGTAPTQASKETVASAVLPTPTPPPPEPLPETNRGRGGNNGLMLGLGAVIIAAVAGAAFHFMQPSSQAPTQAPVAMPVPEAQPPVSVKLTTLEGDRQVFGVGDSMVLNVEVDQDSSVYCFYRMANGSVIRIFPNRFQPTAEITARQSLLIPGKDTKFKITFDTPGAEEHIGCYAAPGAWAANLPAEIAQKDLQALGGISGLDDLDAVFARAAGSRLGQARMTVRTRQPQ